MENSISINEGKLIPLQSNNGKRAVNARDLHLFLESKRDFSNWIKDRITKYDFVENQDYLVFNNFGDNPKGGRPSIEYALSINMAKELSMVENNERGKQARRYFIACEEALKKNQCTKYAERIVKKCVKEFNRSLMESLSRGQKKFGYSYGVSYTSGEIKYNLKESIDANLERIFDIAEKEIRAGFLMSHIVLEYHKELEENKKGGRK